MDRTARPSLDQREARIGDMRVLYCAARRRTGDWIALGNLVDDAAAPRRRAALVSGSGTTEMSAVERMLLRASERAGAHIVRSS